MKVHSGGLNGNEKLRKHAVEIENIQVPEEAADPSKVKMEGMLRNIDKEIGRINEYKGKDIIKREAEDDPSKVKMENMLGNMDREIKKMNRQQNQRIVGRADEESASRDKLDSLMWKQDAEIRSLHLPYDDDSPTYTH